LEHISKNGNIYSDIFNIIDEWMNIRYSFLDFEYSAQKQFILNKKWKDMDIVVKNTINYLYAKLFNNENYFLIETRWLSIWFCMHILVEGKYIITIKEKISKGASYKSGMRLLNILIEFTLECLIEIIKEGKNTKTYSEFNYTNGLFNGFIKIHRIPSNYLLPFRNLIIPEAESDDISTAQIPLICEYSYEVLGIPRALKIEIELNKLFSPQVLLYGAKKAYRDHLLHVIDVCLLGHLLFETHFTKYFKTKRKSCWILNITSIKDRKIFLAKWYLTALFHDTGYLVQLPMQLIEGIDILESEGLKNYAQLLNDSLDNAKKEFDKYFNESIKVKLNRDEQNTINHLGNMYRPIYDHGIISATHLDAKLKLLDMEGSYNKLYHDSVWAIARHEMPIRSFSPDSDKLFFLLFLCDKIQEWGRPRIDKLNIAHKMISSLRGDNETDFDWSRTVQFVKVNLSCKLKKQKKRLIPFYKISGQIPNQLIFQLKYNNSLKSGAEITPGWIKLLYELAKIGKSNWLPPIIIESWHPMENQENQLKEIDKLHLFAQSNLGSYASPTVSLIHMIKNISNKNSINAFDSKIPFSYVEGQEQNNLEWFQLNFVLSHMYSIKKENRILQLPDSYYSDFDDWKEIQKKKDDKWRIH